MIQLLAVAAAGALHIGTSVSGPRVGDSTEILVNRETTSQTDDQSSGSSTDRDAFVERVVAVRPDGVELEFDLPKSLSVEEKAGNWQFPARVYRPNHGPAVLLNDKEMEARVDGWLKRGQMTRAVCGHWIFTWNAFKIECDPQSVMETINRIDLNLSEIRDGVAYNDPDASQPALLRRASTAVGGATFSVEMKIDPEKFRRERAETDVIVAEMSRRVLTKADALKARAKDDISGDISIEFLADRTGTIARRAKVTRLQIRERDGKLGKEVISETITRRPLPHRSK